MVRPVMLLDVAGCLEAYHTNNNYWGNARCIFII